MTHKSHHLEESLLVDPFESIKEADLGDAWSQKGCEPLYYDSCACSKLDYEVLKCLALNPDVPAILVLSKVLAPGQWQYHSEVLTDQGPEEVCISTIREKLLQCLPKEVPHSMTQQIEIWKESEDGVLDISIKLHVKKELSDSISVF
ncbi:hypothetical protein cypCar_00031061 [Cyprinus carpio]|nr:hypothetical protein cypCar_00031061 [Cyprinus carpio]